MVWKSLFGRGDEDEPGAAPAPAQPAEPFAVRMRTAFEKLRWDARRAGGILPVAALPMLGRIEDTVGPLLDHLEANPPSVDEEIAVESMLTDYLPTAINTYVGLNRAVAVTTGADGRTPGDALVEQLATLESAVRQLSVAIYTHNAQELATHGRFLDTKFSGSDLDL